MANELEREVCELRQANEILRKASAYFAQVRKAVRHCFSTAAVAPCCPDVSTFEGSKGGRTTYFGFDDKTNLVATVGTDEYWLPPAMAKTLPGSKLERDGGRWVSVGVGQEAQVEMSFAGTYTAACLANCTFEIVPVTIADLVTTSILASGTTFKIKGKAAGEASVKVICNGKLRGYFHTWCAAAVTLKLDIGTIKTARAPAATYAINTIQTAAEEIFQQSIISFSVRDLGIVDLSADAATTAAETVALTTTTFTTTAAFTSAMHAAAEKALLARSLPPPPRLHPRQRRPLQQAHPQPPPWHLSSPPGHRRFCRDPVPTGYIFISQLVCSQMRPVP